MKEQELTERQLVGSRIREARINRHMSQADLAVKANISLPHISNIEQGKTGMKLESFIRIIEALQVSADCPYAAVGVAAYEMIRHEADHRGGDHIQKGFDGRLLTALRNRSFRFLCQNGCLLFSVEASRPWSGTPPRPVMN